MTEDTKDADKNASRQAPKEAKSVNFADRLASLSDSQLKGLAKIVNDEVKQRAGKASVLESMTDKEFSDLKEELVAKSEKEKKKDAA